MPPSSRASERRSRAESLRISVSFSPQQARQRLTSCRRTCRCRAPLLPRRRPEGGPPADGSSPHDNIHELVKMDAVPATEARDESLVLVAPFNENHARPNFWTRSGI